MDGNAWAPFGIIMAGLAIWCFLIIMAFSGGEDSPTFEERCLDKGGKYASVDPYEACEIDGVLVQED